MCIDSKTSSTYLNESAWQAGLTIEFRGAKKDYPERETNISVLVEEQDVVALFAAFLKTEPKRLFELLADDMRAKDAEIERLYNAELRFRATLRRLRPQLPEQAQKELDSILRCGKGNNGS